MCKGDTEPAGVSGCAFHACIDGNAWCTSACKDRGVASVSQRPSVADSTECSQYCEKAASLNCTRASTECRHNACSLQYAACTDALRAELACKVGTGTWSCDSYGNLSVTSTCRQSSACSADAGAD